MLVDVNSGAARTPLPHPSEAALVGPPAWVSDSVFYCSSNRGKEFAAIVRHDLETGETTTVPRTGERFDAEVIARGTTIIVLENRDGANSMWPYDARTGTPGDEIPLPEPGVTHAWFLEPPSLSIDGSRLRYTLTTPRLAGDVYDHDLRRGERRRLTDRPTELGSDAHVQPELDVVESFDGERLPLFIFRPRVAESRPAPRLLARSVAADAVDAIRAPLFVIHGRNDPRVPLAEAEQLVSSLERRGVRHQLCIYDDEGHGLARLNNQLDAYPRAIGSSTRCSVASASVRLMRPVLSEKTGGGSAMTGHRVGTQEEWQAERDQLLKEEKELTRRGDALARQRRELPWVAVDQDYEFETNDGTKSLRDLFAGRSQLAIYHFMFGPGWEAGCPVCSSITDTLAPQIPHLKARDTTLLLVSRAPLERLLAYGRRMGWGIDWVSTIGGDFNRELGFLHTEDELRPFLEGDIPPTVVDLARRCGTDVKGYVTEGPGLSVYALSDGTVYRTYVTTARGLEFAMAFYPLLDRVPKGRNESATEPLWIRRHDEYEGQ